MGQHVLRCTPPSICTSHYVQVVAKPLLQLSSMLSCFDSASVLWPRTIIRPMMKQSGQFIPFDFVHNYSENAF